MPANSRWDLIQDLRVKPWLRSRFCYSGICVI